MSNAPHTQVKPKVLNREPAIAQHQTNQTVLPNTEFSIPKREDILYSETTDVCTMGGQDWQQLASSNKF